MKTLLTAVLGWARSPYLDTVKITEVDEYQRSNPFILTGYRGRLGLLACCKSIIFVHNETINIWTHLLGFVFFLGLLVHDLLILPYAKATYMDLAVLIGLLICYQACMLLSSVFHTFSCHSKSVSEITLSLDMVGITLGLLATYLSGVYYAFYCQDDWRAFYLVTVMGFFLLAVSAQFLPKFTADEYSWLRISLFTVWSVYGFVPTLHWVLLHGGFDNELVTALLPRIFIMYSLCGLAFAFYISKTPERFIPGTVDFFGHSHQWWHVFIFLALLFWHQTGISFAFFRLDHGCPSDLPKEALEHINVWPFN